MDSQLNKVVASPGGDGGLRASCQATQKQKATKRTSDEITSSEMTLAKRAKLSIEAAEETLVPEPSGEEEKGITSSEAAEGGDSDLHYQDNANTSSVEILPDTDEASEVGDDLGSETPNSSSNSGSSEDEDSDLEKEEEEENPFSSQDYDYIIYSQTSSSSSELEISPGFNSQNTGYAGTPPWDIEP